MASDKLDWCIVRLGEDYNWWVHEVSDDIHWDADGIGILDPKQVERMVDLLVQMKPYGLREDIVEAAFLKYSIDKELPKNMVRLASCREDLLNAKDKIFAMPNIVDDIDGPYMDFLDHIISTRVKMLNANLDFQQPMEPDEIEEAIRDEQQSGYVSGKTVHAFEEIISILDYLPAGYSLDPEDEEQNKEDSEFSAIDDDLGEEDDVNIGHEEWEE